MSVKDVLKFAADEKAAYVNVRFTDLVGAWHHLTFPIEELSEKPFEEGFGFDGSSLPGWVSIHESDMLLVPDPYRYWIDPFMEDKTLCLVADVVDPSCNPYLAFSAMLLAGLDGIQNRTEPGEPLDKDIYDLAPEQLKEIPSLPGSLDESLNALEGDHAFLLKGDVFTPALIERWISYKREREIHPPRLLPHPLESTMYYATSIPLQTH